MTIVDVLRSAGRRLPNILQTEASECAVACLAMVSSYYGRAIDLNTLRREYHFSGRGTNLSELMTAAERMSLTPRALRLEMDDLCRLQTPAILHWGMNHFVVLKKVGIQKIWVHDPAVGPRTYKFTEASRRFTGIAVELTPSRGFESKNLVHKLRLWDLWQKSSGIGRVMVQLLLLSMVLQVATLVSPLYMQIVVDEALVKHDVDLLLVIAVGFFLFMLIKNGTSILRSYVALHLGTTVGYQLAVNLFHHLIRLPITFFERRHVGDVSSRFQATEEIRRLLTDAVISTILDGMMTVVTLIMMYLYSSILATIVLGSVVIYVLIRLIRLPFETVLKQEALVAGANEHSTFIETIRSMLSVKSFGRERERGNLWQNDYAESIGAGVRQQKFGINVQCINSLIRGIENILVIYLGGRLVLDGELTIGMLFAFVSYKNQFTGAVISFVSTLINFRLAGVQLERMADIAFSKPEIGHDGPSKFRIELMGQIELDQISFRYGQREPWIIENTSLRIVAGECVVLRGLSGSGKSTVMKIMLGLLPTDNGDVRMDGYKLDEIGLENVRSQVAAVMQGDTLMAGNIAENICFFDTTLDMELIVMCCQMAQIHDEILGMPMKYETRVGDMGVSMSYGQRQRLLIARALYANPRLLFLDEATSHIDVTSESAILKAVKTMGITLVVISHRPEVWQMADRVLTIEDGRIEVQAAEEEATAECGEIVTVVA